MSKFSDWQLKQMKFHPTYGRDIGFSRPTECDGGKLHYKQIPRSQNFDNNSKVWNKKNRLILIFLYKRSYNIVRHFYFRIPKESFVNSLESVVRLVKPTRISRLLQRWLDYDLNSQDRRLSEKQQDPETGEWNEVVKRPNAQFYKFYHSLDLRYALEFAILEWLPWFLVVTEQRESKGLMTAKEFEHHLQNIRASSDEDLINRFG